MPELQPLVEDEGERPAVETVEALLGRRVKVVTKNGRTFIGSLTCLDHFGNVLLFDAIEDVTLDDLKAERHLQQAIVSLDDITSASVLVASDDKVLQIMLEDEIKAMRV